MTTHAHLRRSSGILLHPTSLPGRYGIGTLGAEAFDFLDFLAASGQKLWQILPLGPSVQEDHSPYSSASAFAGNHLLIDLDGLVEEGLLKKREVGKPEGLKASRVDFAAVTASKTRLLTKACRRFFPDGATTREYRAFCRQHRSWLEDYALYAALKTHFGNKPWFQWPDPIRLRRREAVKEYKEKLSEGADFHRFAQFVFFRQWSALRERAREHGIQIIGDLAIYVGHDSADVWSKPKNFQLDKNRDPVRVAGVPPDLFSKTGQLWGNPVYDWKHLAKTGFKWWLDRLRVTLGLVDIIRLDHFRGFAGYWAIPFGDETAENGRWERAPGTRFFAAVERELGHLPIVVEDLGEITPDVVRLRDRFQLPGMKILQFAFDGDSQNEFLPHNYAPNSVVYTGTHDNDTTRDWFQTNPTEVKRQIRSYLNSKGRDQTWNLIRLAWSSVAVFAIAPMQDILNLGETARMNVPGSVEGNWAWKLDQRSLKPESSDRLAEITEMYGR